MANSAGSMAGLTDAVRALRAARRITAVCHENPDADTIGAAVAVSLIAQRLGAETEIVSCDSVPPALDFLPNLHLVRKRPLLHPDLIVVCDAATRERVGRVADDLTDATDQATILNVDHHRSSDNFGDINLVDPDAAATCEVLFGVVEALGLELDEPIATALLTGIIRDSNGLSTDSTSATTLRAVARLVEAGAPLPQIHRVVLSDLPFPTVTVWGRLLGEARAAAAGRVIYAVLTNQMLTETGTQQHDADGAVEFLSRTKGVDVTLLLRELGPREVRVSVRTSSAVDAIEIARQFGGGGHPRRAGCVMQVGLPSAIERLVAACEAVLA